MDSTNGPATGVDPGVEPHLSTLFLTGEQMPPMPAAPVPPVTPSATPSSAPARTAVDRQPRLPHRPDRTSWRSRRWWASQGRKPPRPAQPSTTAPDEAAAPPRRRRMAAADGAPRRIAKARAGLLVPRPDVFSPPAALRGVHAGRIGGRRPEAGFFLLAAHGGAGTGLLQRLSLLPAGEPPRPVPAGGSGVGWDAGSLWPDPALQSTGAVVVVTRTTVPGLTRARDLAAQYLAGAAPPGTTLLGVVVVADQPGKTPSPVAKSVALLDGVYARTWEVPYVRQYRLIQPDDTPPVHPVIADVLADIRTTLTQPHPTEGTFR